MTFKKLKNLIFGVAMLLLSGFYLYTAQHIKTRTKLTPGYASAMVMPTLLGVLLAVLSVILIVESIVKLKKGTADNGKEEKGDMLAVMVGLFAIGEIMSSAQTIHKQGNVSVTQPGMKNIKGFGFSLSEFFGQSFNAIRSAVMGMGI